MFFAFAKRSAALLSLALIPASYAVSIPVTVGGTGILKFTPDSVTANIGDVVVFTFKQKNHSATQSTLASPCTHLPSGFNTGFIPVDPNNTNGPFQTAELNITSTDPIWVYCAQTGHCQSGMVFAVNPGDKLAQFQAAATGNSSASPSGASPTPSGTSPTPGTGTNHTVIVGGTAGLVFTPPNITANAGDTVTFQFQQKNHTATQSTFASPCSPMAGGFDSGFNPVAAGAATFPTYTVQINSSTTPVWVYCAQTGHCSQGMVFAVNAPATGNTFDAYQANAKGGGSGASGAASPAPTSGASRMGMGSTLALGLLGAVAGLA